MRLDVLRGGFDTGPETDGDGHQFTKNVIGHGHGGNLGNTVVEEDGVLNFLGGNLTGQLRLQKHKSQRAHVLATADDNVLDPVRNVKEPLIIKVSRVTSVEPTATLIGVLGGLCQR